MNGQYEISKPDYPEPTKYEHNQCGFSLKDYDLLYFMRSYSLHQRGELILKQLHGSLNDSEY